MTTTATISAAKLLQPNQAHPAGCGASGSPQEGSPEEAGSKRRLHASRRCHRSIGAPRRHDTGLVALRRGSLVVGLLTAAFSFTTRASANPEPTSPAPVAKSEQSERPGHEAPSDTAATGEASAPGAAPEPGTEARSGTEPREETAAEDPRGFMDRVFNRSNWNDMKAQITLTLTNQRGDERVRRIDLRSSHDEQGASRMLMRFVEPADVRGTAFLLIEHEDTDDDRRLWMPALRRVQRISASGAGGNFMSSDFTYYDIGRPELSDWSFSHQGSGEAAGTPCELILGTASSEQVIEDTGYSTIKWCVDPERLVVLGAEYTDQTGQALKTLRVDEVEDVAGTPFATRMSMEDAGTGHRSLMVFSELEIDTGIEDEVFTERSLRRGR